jgi:hypothetical protein
MERDRRRTCGNREDVERRRYGEGRGIEREEARHCEYES